MGTKQDQQHQTDQKVAPTSNQTQVLDPVPPPPSQEAQQAAIRVVANEYVGHMRSAHDHDVSAKTLAARIEAKVRHIAEEQAELERMEKQRRDEEHAARTRRDFAHAHALMLGGVGVPLPSVEVEMAPPAEAEVVQHTLVWNGSDVPGTGQWSALSGSHNDVPPAGHCIRCGKRVWRITAQDGQPVLVHADNVLPCEPNSSNSQVADLGEVSS